MAKKKDNGTFTVAKRKHYYTQWITKDRSIEQDWDPNITTSTHLVASTAVQIGVPLGEKVKDYLSQTLDAVNAFELDELEVGIPGLIKAKFKRKR